MAKGNTRPLTPSHLQPDIDAYAAIKAISGYTPSNTDFKPAKGITTKNAMEATEEKSA